MGSILGKKKGGLEWHGRPETVKKDPKWYYKHT